MQKDKENAINVTGIYRLYYDEEVKKTTQELSLNDVDKYYINKDNIKNKRWFSFLTAELWFHFLTLFILGILTWSLLWCTWSDQWRWDGEYFRLAAVVVVAWGSGQALQALTTLPPLLAALLTGILARNFGILDMRHYVNIDTFLRKVYPVIILGKASLGWDVGYMKSNWRTVTALGVLPWSIEVVSLAVCTHLLLDFPWIWGFLLGSIYASVSCAVVMPAVQRLGNGTDRGTHEWVQLVCTAGGIDTTLSVGVYGLIYSAMFYNTNDVYRYAKASLTLFAGIVLGVTWGSLARVIPHPHNYYVAELRILFVLVGGLCANFITSYMGWGGTGGVAVLACNAIAAMHWARDGWKLNNNPASTAYRVLWAAFEPMVFAYTGTFFVIDDSIWETMLVGLGVLFICLAIRLTATFLVCWNLTLKEKIFICCAWTPKSIVEAVLCPLAIDTLISKGEEKSPEMEYAEDLMRLVVQVILITTPIGFLLTNYLGPMLLKNAELNENGNN